MTRLLTIGAVALLLCIDGPAFAQAKAKVTAPEIPFDQTGAFVKEIGAGSYGFAFAQAVRVDKADNIWAVDEGTNVIQKFSPDGKRLWVGEVWNWRAQKVTLKR